MFIKRFLNYLKTEKRYSPLTITAYKKDLEQFFQFILGQYNISEIKEIHHGIIRSWIVEMADMELSSRSINRKISSLKSHYKYLIREQVVVENPLLKITTPKSSKQLPVFVDQKAMDDLLDKVEFEKGFAGERDKLIIAVLYSTGIRLSELVNLKISAINFYEMTVKVIGKGNKERILPFSTELKKELQEYIKKNDIFDWLFLTDKKKKIYPKLVYRIVNMYLSKVTTIKKKSPHVLRHTFATHMLNNGADLNAIKEFLGHTSLAATQVYTHNTINKFSNIYKQAHPKA